jgi:hypothetical protein
MNMERPRLTPEDRRELACGCLELRLCILEEDRETASPERLRQLDEEQEAIEVRLSEIRFRFDMEPEEFGEPLPCAERRHSVRTPDGSRIETVDSGKEIDCRCWSESDPANPISVTAKAGPYMPFVSVRASVLEESVYSLITGMKLRRRRSAF